MPIWGHRETYPVVTTTVTILAGVFAAAALVRPLIPPPDESPLALRAGEYYQAGARQRVRWLTLADDPFGEAMRQDKPIVLVMGTLGAFSAREFDEATLSQDDVAERLNREFIAVRIDLDESPEWENAYLPLQGAEEGADSGWTVVVLSPSGVPVQVVRTVRPNWTLDPQTFLRMLTAARATVVGEGSLADSATTKRHRDERRVLLAPNPAPPPVGPYVERLRARLAVATDVESGPRLYRFETWDWRLLALIGDYATVRATLGPLLQTPIVNWLDGGFFRGADGPAGSRLRYEGSAVQSADLAALLALLYCRLPDDYARDLAERSFDGVMETFLQDEAFYGVWWSERIGIERSPRFSIRPTALAKALTPEEARWAVERLDLDPGRNPAMVLRVPDPTDYVRERVRYEDVFRRLRAIQPKDGQSFGARDTLDVVARVGARLLEVSRSLEDAERTRRALALFDRAARFRVGPADVVHANRRDGRANVSLMDYLAYADFAAQVYVSTGDERVLRDGLAVLVRALDLFKGPSPGVYRNGLPDAGVLGTDAPALPDLVDAAVESSTGALLRIVSTYLVFFGDDPVHGSRFGRTLPEVSSATAEAMAGASWRMGGVAHGILMAAGERWVVTVGPEAVPAAQALARLAPFSVVGPAVGGVRRDLQARGPGVYLRAGGQTLGPVSVAEAGRLLGLNTLRTEP